MAMIWALVACLFSAAGAAKAELITAQSTTDATDDNEALTQEAAPELQRPSVWGMPTTVDVALYVIDVDALSSAEQNFSASVFYAATWQIPVMRHEGPGPLIRRITDVWTPRLTIINQQQAWSAFPPYVEVSPDGYVTFRQKVWGNFSQPLDLRDFPLDRQTLTVHLAAAGLLETEVRMVPFSGEHGRSSGISSNFSIPDFDIVSWTAESRPFYPFEGEVGTPGFALDIELQRRPGYYFWKVIFPICLIIIMSWAPRWVKPTQIGANVGIATTAFLTLIAYLFAIQNVLPPVSYLTRMDKFILLSIIMVFIGLLHTVVIATLVRKEVTKRIQRTERLARAIYPLALLGVLYVAFKLP